MSFRPINLSCAHLHLISTTTTILSNPTTLTRRLTTSLKNRSLDKQWNLTQTSSHTYGKIQDKHVDIALFSPLLDPHPSETGPYHEIFFGSKPPYEPIPDEIIRQTQVERGNSATIEALLPYSLDDRDLKKLMKFTLVAKRVVNQTGKGKIPSMYTLVVVGNGKGLVGCGEGKSERMGDAANSATKHAIKNLAPVNLFEGRTIHSELRAKFHATNIVMRPRPPGFGLRCGPFLHQVAKAAGISDLSAKITRSNNPMNVIKMSLMMLQSGGSPVGMGDGFGGKGKRLEKGIGMRTADELALMRGRRCEPWSMEDID